MDAVIMSIPGDGGSPWKQVNWNNGRSDTAKRIHWYRAEFRRNFTAMEKIMAVASRREATIILVSPADSDYWRLSMVRRAMARFNMRTTTVSACQLGLVSGRKDTLGLPLNMQWKIATNSSKIAGLGSGRCQDGHKHVPCVGFDAARAKLCPPPLADLILKKLGEERRKIRRALRNVAVSSTPD